MNRRLFFQTTGVACSGVILAPGSLLHSDRSNFENNPELGRHKIVKTELREVKYSWPRFVGKNGRRDDHGQHHTCTVLKLLTDQGAEGWGLASPQVKEHLKSLEGKKISELIIPEKGITAGLHRNLDFALYDLAGIVLNKPVYQLLGARGEREIPVYSGMIYLDELNPGNRQKGLNAILENCEWDYNYGYRQLKVKIGRSGKWYPHDEGLNKDIEVVKLIHENFRNRKVEILVDANDVYTPDDTIAFLSGIGDIPLLWMEEPFHENFEDGKKLRTWMNDNGFKETLYADGEADTDHDTCMKLSREGILDVYLPDIVGLGFTSWISLMAELKKIKTSASPHAWGNGLKTRYIAQLAAGLGNIVTIEGVTCVSDEIDFGEYPVIDGKIQVPEKPGFGMNLLT